MKDDEFTMALRLRLGMPPTDSMPDRCACGYDMEKDHNHFLNCPRMRGSVTTRQHHRLVRTRAHYLTLAGYFISLELTMRSKQGRRYRPDTIAWSGQHSHMSDATRVNATAPSHIAAAQKAGRVVKQAEDRKTRDYDNKVMQLSYDCPGPFFPIGYEVHGTWGKGAEEALNNLRAGAKSFLSERAANKLADRCRDSISIEIQRGNARLQRVGLDKARSSKHNLLCDYIPHLPRA